MIESILGEDSLEDFLQETRPRVYVASRASAPKTVRMWRQLRDRRGANIISSWIDEAGPGETKSYPELWNRIEDEIATCDRLVFYASASDLPVKDALVEVGIAMGLNKPIYVLANVELEGDTDRPLGSWIRSRHVVSLRTQATIRDLVEAIGL